MYSRSTESNTSTDSIVSGIVIFSVLRLAGVSPKRERWRTTDSALIAAVKNKAKPICPIPVARPTAIAKKIVDISLLVPGVLRKRTSENAPMIATPVPRFPLTSRIIVWMMAGNRTMDEMKLFEYVFLIVYAPAITKPQNKDAARHVANCVTVSALESMKLVNIHPPLLNNGNKSCHIWSMNMERFSARLEFGQATTEWRSLF